MHNKLLIAIILISMITGACTLTRGHQWGDDFAWYILQAKSIVDGTMDEFMEVSAFTNYQSTTHLGPLAYPWGYPLILVPIYGIKNIHPLALKLPGLFFYAGFLVCLYLFAKDRFTRIESLLFVSLFAFNPLLLRFLDQILSDIPFLFFSTLALWLMVQEGRHNPLHYAAIGASVFCMAFLRMTGVLLLGCFLIVEFFRLLQHRQDRATVMEIIRNSFIACFVFTGLLVFNLLLFPNGGESYLSQYTGLLETAKEFAGAYFHEFMVFRRSKSLTYLYYFAYFLLRGHLDKTKTGNGLSIVLCFLDHCSRHISVRPAATLHFSASSHLYLFYIPGHEGHDQQST
jgi:hypothetical protein